MKFNGKLGLQQRVLPSYRVPFFDLLAQQCEGGMTKIAKHIEADNLHLFGGALYFCYQWNFIRWLEEWNPNALIMEANPRYLASPSAVNWMHKRGRRVLGWGLGAPKQSGLWKRFIRQFDGMIAYSQRGAEEYAALGFPREKIFVAHNSVSAKPEKPDDRPLTIDHATILFVGRLQARKRIDSLLRACAEMDSKPRLLIIGDGPEREALVTLAKEIYPSAEFIGAKHGIELKPYFQQADLFVLPGTGGLAVQEAMSYGLPVIVAKGDGTQDDLVREKNGWQIEPENYGTLVDTMKNALSDIARLREMGKESFRIVAEEINIEKMAEAFVRGLNSL